MFLKLTKYSCPKRQGDKLKRRREVTINFHPVGKTAVDIVLRVDSISSGKDILSKPVNETNSFNKLFSGTFFLNEVLRTVLFNGG